MVKIPASESMNFEEVILGFEKIELENTSVKLTLSELLTFLPNSKNNNTFRCRIFFEFSLIGIQKHVYLRFSNTGAVTLRYKSFPLVPNNFAKNAIVPYSQAETCTFLYLIVTPP